MSFLFYPLFSRTFYLAFFRISQFFRSFNAFLFCLEVLLAFHIPLFLFVFLPFFSTPVNMEFLVTGKDFATGNSVLPC